jgi:hypothetical protein
MKNVYVDFDGVLNSYQTPYTTPDDLPDPPVQGAISWLMSLIEEYHVTIFTTRMLQGEAQAAIVDWLIKWGMPMESVEELSFSCIKGGADVYIDDRAYRFTGIFPTIEELENMQPWHKSTASILNEVRKEI